MNTAEFLNALRARPDLPLAFSTPSGSVPAGFHLTEVKRVAHDTVDCGSIAHNWIENQFELWTPTEAEPGRRAMLAGKFLSIVEKVRRILSLDERAEARVFGRVSGGSDQLHSIESVETSADAIHIRLEPVSASCKARDRRLATTSTSAGNCCGGAEETSSGAGCGCDSRKSPPTDADALGLRSAKDTWFSPFESQGFRFMI